MKPVASASPARLPSPSSAESITAEAVARYDAWRPQAHRSHLIQPDDSLCLLWRFRFFALAAPPTRLLCPDTDRWSRSGFAHTATCFTSRRSTVTRPAFDPQSFSERHTIGAIGKSAAVYKAIAALLQHQLCSGHRCTCLARLHLGAIQNGRGRDMWCTARIRDSSCFCCFWKTNVSQKKPKGLI